MLNDLEELPHFSPEIYTQIAMNDLVAYAVYYLSQSGNEINTEGNQSDGSRLIAGNYLFLASRFCWRSSVDTVLSTPLAGISAWAIHRIPFSTTLRKLSFP
jgi:hypothetical protein